MTLRLDAYAARLPEIGQSDREGYVLLEVRGERAPAARHYRLSDDASPVAAADVVRTPLSVAFAIDASSSMRGIRFALALEAARELVDSLRDRDHLSVVTFSRQARTILGSLPMDAKGRNEARALLDRVATSHGTNLAAGWREAADALSRTMIVGAVRRVLLLTDGAPSQGETDPSALEAIVAQGRANGIETSVIGLGEGIAEELCVRLARGGDGRFHYVRDEGRIADAVALEIEGARGLAADDVEVVLAFSSKIVRAEIMHRYPCRPEGRTMLVRIGSVSYDVPRTLLAQFELEAAMPEATLGAALAKGRRVGLAAIEHEPDDEPGRSADAIKRTRVGHSDPSDSDDGVSSERLALSLAKEHGGDEARRRVAFHVLSLRTLAEVKSAWDAFDVHDHEAVTRRLGRARQLREALRRAGLVETSQLAQIPDVDEIESVMGGGGGAQREARRTFSAWSHNTMVSQIVPMNIKKDDDPNGGGGDGGGNGGGGDGNKH